MAQHSRIHERESRHQQGGLHGGSSKGKFYNKGSNKGYNKSKAPWRSYYAEDEREEAWENASQSLGGYEDYDDAAYYGENAEHYNDDCEDPIYQAFQAMIDEGLDETNQESIDHASHILHAEREVFYARQKAQETGHYGFWSQGRSYEVRGNLMLEEKKARIQAMKAKTTCRRCGRYGHWGDDAACRKNVRKGGNKGKGPKGATSSTTSTVPSKGGKSGKSKGQDKPRTVYFTVNEYEEDKATASTAYMVVKVEDKSADEMLDEMIREAQIRSQVESMRPENLPQRLQDEHAALVAQLSAPEDMWQRSASRMCYLDLYLARYENRQDPEWQDAYQERWSEMVPGHPLFGEQDRQNLARWAAKAAQGLPKIPELPSAGSGITEDQRRALRDAERRQAEQEHDLPRAAAREPIAVWSLPTCEDNQARFQPSLTTGEMQRLWSSSGEGEVGQVRADEDRG